MSRRRLLLAVGAVALLGVAGFALFLWLTKPTPGVTWENYRHLRLGMSARDVEMLLGEEHDGLNSPYGTAKVWRGEKVVITLTFNNDLRVMAGFAVPPGPGGDAVTGGEGLRTDESFLDRIRRWLHF